MMTADGNQRDLLSVIYSDGWVGLVRSERGGGGTARASCGWRGGQAETTIAR